MLACAFAPAPLRADEPTTQPGITDHNITLNGEVLHYRATAAELTRGARLCAWFGVPQLAQNWDGRL